MSIVNKSVQKTVVAIYCRLSDEDRNKSDPKQDSRSIQTQKNMLIQYAVERGWQIYQLYSDDDFSGADANRPQYNEMLRHAEEGKFNLILCKSQSRFTRDLEHVEKFIHDKFKEWGIRFVSVIDNADTEVKGNKKARQINGLVNEWYIEDLSENMRAVLKAKKKNGEYVGSFCPYGYIKSPKNCNRLIVDEGAAPVVRRIFHLYLHEHLGAERIAIKLNQEGILCPARYKREVLGLNFSCTLPGSRERNRYGSGKRQPAWSVSSVLTILKNYMYTGALVQNKSSTVSYKNHTRLLLPESEWIVVEDAHEGIITKETYDRVQEILRSNRRITRTGNISLFSGLLFCGECGGRLVMNSSCRDGRRYYICCNHRYNPKECGGMSLSEKPACKAILKELKKYTKALNETDLINSIIGRPKEMGNLDGMELLKKQLERKQERLSRLDQVMKTLYADRAMGIVDTDQFLLFNKSYLDDRRDLFVGIKELEQTCNGWSNPGKRETREDVRQEDQLELVKGYKDPELLTRQMAEALIEHIIVFRTDRSRQRKLEIKWKF